MAMLNIFLPGAGFPVVRVVLLALCVSRSGVASTITYDEAVDGDLPAMESGVFDLGNGINSFSGTFGNGSSRILTADMDAFRLRFAPGQVLEAASLYWKLECTMCPPAGSSGFYAAWVSSWRGYFVGFLIGSADPAPDLLDVTADISAPLTPFLIPFETSFQTSFAASIVPAVSYTWTFTVVPAPSAVWLLGSALLPIVFRGAGRLSTLRS